jgi:predicted PurR-regulated permease PerM
MLKRNWSRQKALWILSGTLFLTSAVPMTIFFIRGAGIITEFFSQQSFTLLIENALGKVTVLVDKVSTYFHFDQTMLREKFEILSNSLGSWILKMFSELATQIPDLALVGLVTMLSFYFFLSEEEKIRNLFNRYFYFNEINGNKFVSVLKSSCREVFLSNVLTGVLQSLIVSIAALLCNIGDFYIIFIITFIISFIPIIGAAPMAFAIGLFAFFDGHIGAGIVMSIVGVFSGLADNLVRPYLSSLGEIEVPAFIGFLSVIGGVIIFGLPGLFIGPLLASMVYGILPIIIDEYFPKDLDQNSENEV